MWTTDKCTHREGKGEQSRREQRNKTEGRRVGSAWKEKKNVEDRWVGTGGRPPGAGQPLLCALSYPQCRELEPHSECHLRIKAFL